MKASYFIKVAVTLLFIAFSSHAFSQADTKETKKETTVKSGTKDDAKDKKDTKVAGADKSKDNKAVKDDKAVKDNKDGKDTKETKKVEKAPAMKSEKKSADAPKTRSAGEPVPGAEIYLEQEPDDKKK